MEQVLSGLRIVEFGNDVAAANVGRLLSAYGAEVVLVEPPEGNILRHLPPYATKTSTSKPDLEKSILFAYMSTGKKSVLLDLNQPENIQILRDLVLSSDGVVDSYQPGYLTKLGIDLEALSNIKPSLCVTRISPYGQTGPKSSWKTSALTSFASGGQMYLTGDPDREPLMTAGHQAHIQGSLHALGGTLTALFAAEKTGKGDVLDISLQEVQLATLEGAGPAALWYGSEQPRGGNNPRALWGVHPCKDGWIGVASMPRQTHSVLDTINASALKDDPLFKDNTWSQEADDLLRHLVPLFTLEHDAEEIFKVANSYRAPFAMIPEPSDLLKWRHYQEIDFWQKVTHPVLGEHPVPSGPIWFSPDEGGEKPLPDKGMFRPAPTLGQHTKEVLEALSSRSKTSKNINNTTESTKCEDPYGPPLKGLRVIDMTQVWSGPYAARFLADMGADVIKVEGPTFPDPIRTATRQHRTGEPDINVSAYFSEYNRGKRGFAVDIKPKSGLEALKKLIATADVFLENWSSGVADRNSLGYEDIRAINPKIIYVTMPGFGHQGSDSSMVGFGPTIEQMGGLVALQGYKGGEPHKTGISYGDPIAGATCAAAIAAALLRREKTGYGCYCVLPQRDGVTGLVGEFFIAESLGFPMELRLGNSSNFSTPHNIYPCKPDDKPRIVLGPDRSPVGELFDRWIAIDCQSDKEWEVLKKTVNDPRLNNQEYSTLQGRLKYTEQIDKVISEWTCEKDPHELENLLQSKQITASSVATAASLLNDNHIKERNVFISVTHSIVGTHNTVRPTWRFSNRTSLPSKSSPLFGEHNEEILKDLGYDEEIISSMKQSGAISKTLLGNR